MLIFIFIIVKIPKESEYYNDCDATYHTIYVMKCYEETPISIHKFLPIVSMGHSEDKGISWGACVADRNGENYYYTSFSPATFLAPYIFVKLLNLPINIYSLYAFNSLLCIITLIFTIIIFCKLFSKYINKNIIIIATTLLYLFQIEVMQSNGAVYWVHSISQMLIAIQFWSFINYKNRKLYKGIFYSLCLILPYVEWTGYVSNCAYALMFLVYNIFKEKKLKINCLKQPFLIGLITICSFSIFSMHFLLNLDLKVYLKALKDRFLARNINCAIEYSTLTNLIKGYIISYKYIIVFDIIIFIILLTIKEYRKNMWTLIKEYKYLIFFFVFIMLENILMLEHAITYTFDRLKFIYIIIITTYILLSTILKTINNSEISKKLIMNSFIISISIIAITNLYNYNYKESNYHYKNVYFEANSILSKYVNENYTRDNSTLCSSYIVRGYENLLFNRSIHECTSFENAKQIAISKNKEFLVYVNTYLTFNVNEIFIVDFKQNKTQRLYVKNNELIIEQI